MKKGRYGPMTHGYNRHGTTTLFAALNVLEGTVIGVCMSRHRHHESLKFRRKLDRDTPDDLALPLILDNYAAAGCIAAGRRRTAKRGIGGSSTATNGV